MTYTTLSEDKRFRLLDILQKNKGKLKDKSIFDRTNEIKQIQLYLNRSKLLDN